MTAQNTDAFWFGLGHATGLWYDQYQSEIEAGHKVALPPF